jgi:hypothetical protein
MADQARRSALEDGAGRWAAAELARTEKTLSAARAEDARQMGRLAPLRDAGESRRRYGDATRAARAASRAAGIRRAEAEVEIGSLVRQADAALGGALELIRSARLPPADRQTLQRGRLALREAKARLSAGDLDEARERVSASHRDITAAMAHVQTHAARYVDPANLERWRNWIDDTWDGSRRTRGVAIVVVKDRNELMLLEAGTLRWRVAVELGANGVSDKSRSGDRATPEGRYVVVERRGPGSTRYHKALLLDYPNREDRRRFAEALRAGRIPAGSAIGGLVEIHGEGGRGRNWTHGCAALANDEMDRLFEVARVGTPVTIVGSDGAGGVFSDLAQSARGASSVR